MKKMTEPNEPANSAAVRPRSDVRRPRILIGISGSSGAAYGLRFLRRCPGETHLIVSRWGEEVLRLETDTTVEDLRAAGSKAYRDDDLAAPWASGSNRYDALVLIPCSLSTLGKVAGGLADTLITRAAQVALKERMRLVLCVRETPWSTITLKNALAVSEAGGIVMPVAPPWYRRPASMEEVVDGFVDKVLGVLGLGTAPGWREEETK